jgi:hypothetical protein
VLACSPIFPPLTIIPRWRTAHYFWSKYFENQARYEKGVLIYNFKSSFKWDKVRFYCHIPLTKITSQGSTFLAIFHKFNNLVPKGNDAWVYIFLWNTCLTEKLVKILSDGDTYCIRYIKNYYTNMQRSSRELLEKTQARLKLRHCKIFIYLKIQKELRRFEQMPLVL